MTTEQKTTTVKTTEKITEPKETAVEENTTNFSKDIVIATINYILSSQDVFDYEVSYNDETYGYMANIWYDGLALGIASDSSQFVEFQQTSVESCKNIHDSMQELDPGAHFAFFILNDINKENVLITILDGIVISSVTSE